MRQRVWLTGIQREEPQQLGEHCPAVKHLKLLTGNEQVQTRRVIPDSWALVGILAVDADLKTQRTGLNDFRGGRDKRSQLLCQDVDLCVMLNKGILRKY